MDALPPSYSDDMVALKAGGQFRRIRLVQPGLEAMSCTVEGKRAVNFSSNDYLGLAQHPVLTHAAMAAIENYGCSSSSSRLISGTSEMVLALEDALCQFKQTEAALVFNSGYQANVAILQAILSPGDWVFGDKLNHASLVDGCLLSGARWSRYRHLDLNHLERKLQKAPTTARKWIVTDTVFSMDGDAPDLKALMDLAERYKARVMVDEAHATGLYGDQRSSGLCEAQGVSSRVDLQMGTFSKALGGAGAYVAGSKVLIDTMVNKARGFIYSTALPPSVVASAHAAVQLVQQDPSHKRKLWQNVAAFQECLPSAMAGTKLTSPIIPVIVGESEKTVRFSEELLAQGYFVQGIRPPTVPSGTARLRIAISARHTPEQIQGLATALKALLG